MKRSFLILNIILIGAVAFAQTQNNKPTQPINISKSEVKIVSTSNNNNAADFKFETDQHDFGTIPEGPEAKFDFEFTNTGKEPLILTDVHASCGCTTPVWPKEPIQPGAKSKITAVYNTKGRGGNFTKSITIKSNAKSGDKIIMIKGMVEKAPTNSSPEKAPNIMNELPMKN